MDWTLTAALAGPVVAVAAGWIAWLALRENRDKNQRDRPAVLTKAFVEKTRRLRVQVILTNTGGSRVTVAYLRVVRPIGGTGYSEPEIVRTVVVAPPAPDGSEPAAPGKLTLEASDQETVTLRRHDDSKFGDTKDLRVLVDVVGEDGRRTLMPKDVDKIFYVEGVDAPPPT